MTDKHKKHTPGPWKIDWYLCKMDQSDVEYARENGDPSATIGDVMWRAPNSIGPVSIEHSHWGGHLLDCSDEDARLIAAAPTMYLYVANKADSGDTEAMKIIKEIDNAS